MILVYMVRVSYCIFFNFMSGRNICNTTTCHCCKVYDLFILDHSMWPPQKTCNVSSPTFDFLIHTQTQR